MSTYNLGFKVEINKIICHLKIPILIKFNTEFQHFKDQTKHLLA